MAQTIKPPLPSRSLDAARCLPVSSTDAEIKLWQRLRASHLNGLKFRRQHPVPPYVVDFYCDARKRVVELDGSQHTEEVDIFRTRSLESKGLMVLRFWSNELLTQTGAVVEAIFDTVAHRTLTPAPLPPGEGLKEPTA